MRDTTNRCVSVGSLLLSLVWPAWCFAEEPAGPERWESEIAAFEKRDAAQTPPVGAVVFVGSSSIRLWDVQRSFPGLKSVNRGFGGSQMEDAAYFVDRIVTRYQPATVVVYSGDNDIAKGKSPERIAADCDQLVTRLHATLPETRVIVLSVKPSWSRWKHIDRIRETNERLQELAARHRHVTFVDVHSALLGETGLPRSEFFRNDQLHLNDAGYGLWTAILQPWLTRSSDD